LFSDYDGNHNCRYCFIWYVKTNKNIDYYDDDLTRTVVDKVINQINAYLTKENNYYRDSMILPNDYSIAYSSHYETETYKTSDINSSEFDEDKEKNNISILLHDIIANTNQDQLRELINGICNERYSKWFRATFKFLKGLQNN